MDAALAQASGRRSCSDGEMCHGERLASASAHCLFRLEDSEPPFLRPVHTCDAGAGPSYGYGMLMTDITDVTDVLLADGWHEVALHTFRVGMHHIYSSLDQSDGDSSDSFDLPIAAFSFRVRDTGVLIEGPLPSVLAIMRTPSKDQLKDLRAYARGSLSDST